MAVRKVLTTPAEVLSTLAKPVLKIDSEALSLAEDLVDTMRASPACVGIAAPQIGISLRAFVVDVTGHAKARSCHGTFVMFDPDVVEATEPKLAREGCMSVPDLTGDVARFSKVTVRGLGVDGKRFEVQADAFEARALLHEIDHLDGMVFLDRVAGPQAVYQRKTYR